MGAARPRLRSAPGSGDAHGPGVHETGGVRRTTALALVVVGVLTVAVYVVSFLLLTTDDRPDQLDTEPVVDVASQACSDLRVDVDALAPLPASATAAQREARVREQDRLVTRFLDQVRAVGDEALDADEPSREWLADWELLAQARRAVLAGGTFVEPVLDGIPVSDRMERIGVEACRVPQGLTTPP